MSSGDWERSSLVTTEDKLHAEVERLRRILVHRDAEIAHLRNAAARPVSLPRLALGVASCGVTVAVGVVDAVRGRWRRG